MFNGGVMKDALFTIMLRFRKHIFYFTAAIHKMYRMIKNQSQSEIFSKYFMGK